MMKILMTAALILVAGSAWAAQILTANNKTIPVDTTALVAELDDLTDSVVKMIQGPATTWNDWADAIIRDQVHDCSGIMTFPNGDRDMEQLGVCTAQQVEDGDPITTNGQRNALIDARIRAVAKNEIANSKRRDEAIIPPKEDPDIGEE